MCHGLRLQSARGRDGAEKRARGKLRRGHGNGEASAGNHGLLACSVEADAGEESYTSLSHRHVQGERLLAFWGGGCGGRACVSLHALLKQMLVKNPTPACLNDMFKVRGCWHSGGGWGGGGRACVSLHALLKQMLVKNPTPACLNDMFKAVSYTHLTLPTTAEV